MSGSTRLPLDEAGRIADELYQLLHNVCDRIEVAGSILRRQPSIGDVELICIPAIVKGFGSIDMFGEQSVYEANLLDDLCQSLLTDGVLEYRLNKNGSKAWGSQLKWGIYRGFAVDIYSATPETWGVMMAIRTGSAEFSHKLVMERRYGGFCPSHLEVKGWRVRHRRGGALIDTPEESDVFAALGIEELPPPLRTDSARPRLLART